MIKRFYVDNYRCLSNFELRPSSFQLLLGDNGAGKSFLLQALADLRKLVVRGSTLEESLVVDDLTRWDQRSIQRFELDLEGKGGLFSYRLEVEHDRAKERARVLVESLGFDARRIFHFEKGEVQLFRDDGSAGPRYSADRSRSALATIVSRPDNTLLTWFKERLGRVYVVSPEPERMTGEINADRVHPAGAMERFAEWWSHLERDRPDLMERVKADLKEVIDGFSFVRLVATGRKKYHFYVQLEQEGLALKPEQRELAFEELSTGQRALFALYTLLHVDADEGATLCIDEPDNYVALPEVEPWLRALVERTEDESLQALVVSHHPEAINYLAADHGLWFSREPLGPARVEPLALDPKDPGLPIAELVARRWIRG